LDRWIIVYLRVLIRIIAAVELFRINHKAHLDFQILQRESVNVDGKSPSGAVFVKAPIDLAYASPWIKED